MWTYERKLQYPVKISRPNPAMAKSDGANMLRLDLVEPLIEKLVKIREAII